MPQKHSRQTVACGGVGGVTHGDGDRHAHHELEACPVLYVWVVLPPARLHHPVHIDPYAFIFACAVGVYMAACIHIHSSSHALWECAWCHAFIHCAALGSTPCT